MRGLALGQVVHGLGPSEVLGCHCFYNRGFELVSDDNLAEVLALQALELSSVIYALIACCHFFLIVGDLLQLLVDVVLAALEEGWCELDLDSWGDPDELFGSRWRLAGVVE